MKNIYFPNLNGLRFIAAFLVIIHHIEQLKEVLGYPNYWSIPFVFVVGKLGVVLFFVLSGFLITYLLLVEEKKTNTIAIRNFYIRRVLRIWPLYYLVVILSFFVFSKITFLQIGQLSIDIFQKFEFKLILFCVFLPNLALVLFPPIPYAAQTWSVGVEEQFYLIWPILMKIFKNKVFLLYFVFFGYLAIKFGIKIFENHGFFGNKYLQIFSGVWNTFSINCMAVGGVFAYYLFEKRKILNILYNSYLQILVWSSLLILVGFGITIPYVHYELYAILFGIIILNLSANKKSIISFENRTFNYLGKISYGLYMYHFLGIIMALKGLQILGITNTIIQYITSILLTIIISSLSYYFFERYFIRKKVKFSQIHSGSFSKQG